MTYLDNLLKPDEVYTISNKELPILMQRYPWLADTARKAIEKNINLMKIEEKSDYIYFILGYIGYDCLTDLTEMNYGNFFDTLLFFKKLEDYLIQLFDIKRIENVSKRNIKNKELNLIENICEKLNIEPSIFVLMKIKNHHTSIKFENVSKLNTYTNLLKEK